MSEVQNDFSWKNLFDYFGMQRKFNFLNCIFHLKDLNDTNSFLGIYNLIKFLLLMYQMCAVTLYVVYIVEE